MTASSSETICGSDAHKLTENPFPSPGTEPWGYWNRQHGKLGKSRKCNHLRSEFRNLSTLCEIDWDMP